MSAAAAVWDRIPPTSAFIYGWGDQNTSQPGIYMPITHLKGLNVEAVPCQPRHDLPMLASTWGNDLNGPLHGGEVPRFLCHYPSAQNGAPCFGDQGGGHLPSWFLALAPPP